MCENISSISSYYLVHNKKQTYHSSALCEYIQRDSHCDWGFSQSEVNIERMHAAKECKASSVLSKFKEMEKRVANGEDLEDDAREYAC